MTEGAKAEVHSATKVLLGAVSKFGPMSPEGEAIVKAVALLQKHFGKSADESEELQPAEKQSMVQGMPQQMQKPPTPPGAPPGMPPGMAPPPPPPQPPMGA